MSIVLVLQFLLPIGSALAAENFSSPQNLNATQNYPGDITLTWDDVSSADNYRIYSLGEEENELLTEVSRNRAVLRDMVEGSHLLAVASVSNSSESSLSEALNVEVVYPEMMPPQGLHERLTNGNDIQLRWDEAEYADDYVIYQVTENGRELTASTDRTNQWFRNMPEGNYVFEVASISDRFGESTEVSRLEVFLVHPEMQPPGDLNKRLANGNDIQLRWEESEYATEYHIYEISDEGRELAATTNRTNHWFRDRPEQNYIYEVTSYSDRFGESAEVSRLEVDLVYPEMEPPTGLNERLLNGNDIQLRWDEVEYATKYLIYQITQDGRELVETTDRTNQWFRDMSEGDYIFEVASYSDRFGESEAAAQLEISLRHSDMESPQELHERIINGNDIQLRWNEVDYVTDYRIYQWIDGERELVAVTDRTNHWFRDQPEGLYEFEVTSYSDRFGESSPSQLEVNLIHPEMRPPAGLNERITNGNDIQLRWNEDEYATEYYIYQVTEDSRELVGKTDRTNQWFRDLPEGDYIFEVTSFSDRFGESEEISRLEIDLKHPVMQPPSGLNERIANGNDIQLRWEDDEYATEYYIYQVKEDGRELVETTDRTNQWFRNQPEGEYTFEVTSYSDRFGESAQTSQIAVTVEFPEVEAPVIRLMAEDENDRRIGWSDVGADYYNLYKIAAGEALLIDSTDRTSLWVRDIEDGEHEFVVTAVHDRFGESVHSNSLYVEIQSDITPPVTSSNISKQWLNSSFNVELEAVDDKSGVANTYYSVNGSDFTKGTEFTVNIEGVNEVQYYSVDNAGNVEEVNTEYVKLDKTAPVTTSNVTDEWLNKDAEVQLTAEDGKSGIAATYYSVNGSEFMVGTEFTVTEEGVNEVQYYSVDNAGNVEEVNMEYVKLDKTAPVTTSNVTDEWLNKEAEVQLTAEDGKSGIAATYYSVNGSDFTEGTEFTVTEEGVNEIQYYSVDNAGNVEEVNMEYVKLDKTAPVTTSNVTDEWLNEDMEVQLTAEDGKSGIAATYYSVNGSDFTEGTEFTVTEEGVYEIQYYSVDNAGNVEEVNMENVKIDKTAPKAAWDLNGEYALGTELAVTYEALDSLSGIAEETLTFNGNTLENGDTVFFDQPGEYEVKLTIKDKAGWETTLEKKIVIYIPADLDVRPGIIQDNKGQFTVALIVPEGFETIGFDLESAGMNGKNAVSGKNGYVQQAKNGQFKFNREDFEWIEEEKQLEFRGQLDGYLVVANATVKVQINSNNSNRNSNGKKK
jgi:hypothetical protein